MRLMKKNKAKFDEIPNRDFYQQEFLHDKVLKKRLRRMPTKDAEESGERGEVRDIKGRTM